MSEKHKPMTEPIPNNIPNLSMATKESIIKAMEADKTVGNVFDPPTYPASNLAALEEFRRKKASEYLTELLARLQESSKNIKIPPEVYEAIKTMEKATVSDNDLSDGDFQNKIGFAQEAEKQAQEAEKQGYAPVPEWLQNLDANVSGMLHSALNQAAVKLRAEAYKRAITQPPPVPNDHPAIVDLVLENLSARKRLGIERYGVALQPFNGRDMLQDAIDEAMDLVIYLTGVKYERDHSPERGPKI